MIILIGISIICLTIVSLFSIWLLFKIKQEILKLEAKNDIISDMPQEIESAGLSEEEEYRLELERKTKYE